MCEVVFGGGAMLRTCAVHALTGEGFFQAPSVPEEVGS